MYNFLKKNFSFPVFFLFFTWGIFLLISISFSFFTEKDGGIYSYSWTVNADWMMHLSQVMAFSDLPFWHVITHNPIYVGENLNYPFFVNWISGVFYGISQNIVFAMIIPMIFGTFILLGGAYFLGYVLTKSKWIPFFALLILFFGSGFHIISLFSHFSGEEIMQHTDYGIDSFLVDSGYHWKAFLWTSFLPQRALMWGMGVGFFLFGIFSQWYQQDFKNISSSQLFLLGVGLGTLSYLHTHSLFFAFLFFSVITVWNIKNFSHFFWIGIGAICSAMPFLWLILQKESESFFSFFPLESTGQNPLHFWLQNWGIIPFLFLILWKPLFLKIWTNQNATISHQEKEEELFQNNQNWKIFMGVFIVFILSNIIQFQPNWWDNTKIWVWVLFFIGLMGGNLLKWTWRLASNTTFFSEWSIKTVSLVLSISFIISGIWMSIFPFFSKGNPLQVFSVFELEKAEIFKASIPPRAVILTSDYFKNFVGPLTPNQIVMGYRGWMNSYGTNTTQRIKEMREIFSGGEKAKEYISSLNIDYVLLDASAETDFGANKEYFEKNYPKVLSFSDSSTLYRVNAEMHELQ